MYGQTVYQDVEVRLQKEWARSVEAIDSTLLQFRDTACDELVGATNVTVAGAKWGDDGLPDHSRELFDFLKNSGGRNSKKLLVSVFLVCLITMSFLRQCTNVSKTPFRFLIRKKPSALLRHAEKLKDYGYSKNTKFYAALYKSRERAKKNSGK